MTFCSNCGTQLGEGARFCSKCGSAVLIPSRSSDQIIVTRLRPPRLLLGIIAIIFTCLVVLSVAITRHEASPAERARVQALRDKQGFGLEPDWSKIDNGQGIGHDVGGGSAYIGETATVRQGGGFWPCGSTTEAFDELMKWAALGDNAEVKRTMVTTRSFALYGGMSVKILDFGFGKRKVRVLTNDAGQTYVKDDQGVFPADPRIGRECWVVSEALTR